MNGMTAGRLIIAAAAVVAFLLQLFLSPHIAVGGAAPNFMVALAMAICVAQPRSYNPVVPFVLGLLFDICSGGPVGAMAFSLTALSAATAYFSTQMGNDTLFMSLAVLVAGLLAVEVAYGVIAVIGGYPANPFEAFAFHTLPCFVYDLVIALVLFLAARRLLSPGGEPSALQAEIRQL